MSREILKKAFVNKDGQIILTTNDLHKKVDAVSYTQEKASKKWVIDHDLNTTGVIVQVFDADGRVIWPKDVIINSSFSVTVLFSQNQTGKAVVIGNSLP